MGEQGQGQGIEREHEQAQEHSGQGRQAAAKAKLIFGDPLDQQSGDDSDSGWGGERPAAGSGGRGLDWYLSQRPPHHGG